ncbi:unnamed protein product [Peronospora belbahrii]|uniref:Tetratricopeptide SHNi-TPR domain-containing protein n=1 Tax=Peronospora belbahrii TaxID=622444 RepID=A0AAU9KMA8_9STRA|nr:unnamed protein product [Peronospora belbahrii]
MERNMSTAQELEATLMDPRFLRGTSLLKKKRFEEAIVVFEDLLRLFCEAEGKSESLAVAPIYYEYGNALLSLNETTSSIFGHVVEGSVPNRNENSEKDTQESLGDLEAAWEVMELARVIYSRYPGDQVVEMQLARVYTRLGDLSLESDQYEQAKADFEKALLLRRKLLNVTNAEDTTQLADLYCQLAIACIYRDSTQEKEKKGDSNEGLTYYVMAGRVMAENIHRVAKKCVDKVQVFVANCVPQYSFEGDSVAELHSKGKRKGCTSSTRDPTLTLQFNGERPEALREEFLACVDVTEEQKDALKADEKTLLEYLEIYLELKEKVDGIIETSVGAVPKKDKGMDEAVTTLGLRQTDASIAAAASVVNVVPVKKRKTEACVAKSKEMMEAFAPASSK